MDFRGFYSASTCKIPPDDRYYCCPRCLRGLASDTVQVTVSGARFEERFVRPMETLIRQSDASIWEASEDRAKAKAIYRMLGNESFYRKEIARAHREATIR